MADCRAQGFCAAGVRRWLAAHGVPLERFLAEGVDLAWLKSLNDAYAMQIVAYIEDRGE